MVSGDHTVRHVDLRHSQRLVMIYCVQIKSLPGSFRASD